MRIVSFVWGTLYDLFNGSVHTDEIVTLPGRSFVSVYDCLSAALDVPSVLFLSGRIDRSGEIVGRLISPQFHAVCDVVISQAMHGLCTSSESLLENVKCLTDIIRSNSTPQASNSVLSVWIHPLPARQV